MVVKCGVRTHFIHCRSFEPAKRYAVKWNPRRNLTVFDKKTTGNNNNTDSYRREEREEMGVGERESERERRAGYYTISSSNICNLSEMAYRYS